MTAVGCNYGWIPVFVGQKRKRKRKRKKKKRKRKEEDSQNPCSSMLTSTDRYALTSLMSHLPCRACTNEPEFWLR
jgi:hypothetical protein